MIKSVLFVCLGNICRSPMAEFLLRDKLKKNKLDCLVDSAGTANYHEGKNAHPKTLAICSQNKIDTSNFKSRQLSQNDQNYDLIVCMDDQNFQDTVIKLGQSSKIIKAAQLVNTNYQQIPDPWYDGNYQLTYQLLDLVTDQIIELIKNESKGSK